MEIFDSMSNKLHGRAIEDNMLFDRAQELINRSAHYYPADTVTLAFIEQYKEFDSIPDRDLANFVATHDDFWMRWLYTSRLDDKEQYDVCDSMLRNLLHEDPEFCPALRIMAGIKRLQDSLDQSLKYCNRLLSLNKEDVYAMSLKARTLIKQNKHQEAIGLLNKVFAQDRSNSYAKATLALAYHFSNQNAQRDKLVQEMQKNSEDSTYATYVTDVVTGKHKF